MNISLSDLTVNYRDESGRSCEQHQAVEYSTDGGQTWHGQPTPAQHRSRIVRKIARFLKLRMPPGSRVELRALGVPHSGGTHVESGIFTDATKMAEAAYHYSGAATGVYYCINPVGVLPENVALNETAWGRGVMDQHVSRRTSLFIDIDAEREHKDQPATDHEKAPALKTTTDIADYLTGLGWPEPMVCDSGNGYYLLYKIDLPADDGGIVRRILKTLAQKFGPTVDEKVFNASRISRVPFTWNCKGDDTLQRPHRLARVLKCPDVIQQVPTELLTALANTYTEPTQQPASPSGTGGRQYPVITGNGVGSVSLDQRVRRAEAYIPTMPPSISGSGGHMALWNAAEMIFVGFAVPEDLGRGILDRFNARCQPQWSQTELNHKVRDVLTKNRLPMGFKLAEGNDHFTNEHYHRPRIHFEPVSEIDADLTAHLLKTGKLTVHDIHDAKCTTHTERGIDFPNLHGDPLANIQHGSYKWCLCPKRYAALLRSKLCRQLELLIHMSCKAWNCPGCSQCLKDRWIDHLGSVFRRHEQIYVWKGRQSDWNTVSQYIRRQRPDGYARISMPDGELAVISNVPPRADAKPLSPSEAIQWTAEIINALPLSKRPIHTSRGSWQPPKLSLRSDLFEHVATVRRQDVESARAAAKEFNLRVFKEFQPRVDGRIYLVQLWVFPKEWDEAQIENFHRHVLGHTVSFNRIPRSACREFLDDLAAMDLPETG